MGRWDECLRLCRSGLSVDSGATELEGLREKAERGRKEEAERREKELSQERQLRASALPLAMAVTSRGWRLGRPQFSVGANFRPTLDEDGMIHWPVVLMYPEVMTNDSIEDFHESVPISAHLDEMFGPEAPPLEWDKSSQYKRHAIELYYLANCAKPMNEEQITDVFTGRSPRGFSDSGPKRTGESKSGWVRVDETLALGEILQNPDYVIPGVPVFFVVAKGTEFRQRFLADETKIWKQ